MSDQLTWITPREAMIALDIAPRTVYVWIENGKLRSTKVGAKQQLRVAREDVVKILEGVD